MAAPIPTNDDVYLHRLARSLARQAALGAGLPVLQDSAPMVPKPDLRGRCAEFGTQWMEVWSALGERPQPELSAPAARSPHNPFPL